MLSSEFIRTESLQFGSSYTFVNIFDVNEFIYNYLTKNYVSLDVTNILGSKILILDYTYNGNLPVRKISINIYCHCNINNDYVITFSFQDDLKECGWSTFEKLSDNFVIENFIDSNLKRCGFDKNFNLFSFS